VPNFVEDGPDGTVDFNNDGSPDRHQANVASLPAADGTYVTLVAPEFTSFVDVSVSSILPAAAPPGTSFPLGLFDFTLDGVTAFGSVDVGMFFHSDHGFNDYFNYGPAPGNATPHWYDFEYETDSRTGAHLPTIGPRLGMVFVDGTRGDHDRAAGRVRHLGGPAVVIPNPNPLSGDYNDDGAVGAADYVVWRNSVGQTVTPFAGADGSGNGIIDEGDYLVWRANFGNTLPPGPGGGASAEPYSAVGEQKRSLVEVRETARHSRNDSDAPQLADAVFSQLGTRRSAATKRPRAKSLPAAVDGALANSVLQSQIRRAHSRSLDLSPTVIDDANDAVRQNERTARWNENWWSAEFTSYIPELLTG
jgi:hypothetical protein